MKDTYWKSDREKKAERKICILSLVIAVLIAGMASWKINVTVQAKTQEHLAGEVLRFHVLANSDSKEDQNLKMKVKEAVVADLEKKLPEDLDAEGTREWMRRHTDEMERLGREIVKKEGFDYPVSAAVTTCYFPRKSYGDVTFPAGNYTALRIELGAAEGQNWWCVLYPGLCFLDAVNAVVPEEGKEQLKQVLTEEEYEWITADTTFKVKWYLPELLENLRQERIKI